MLHTSYGCSTSACETIDPGFGIEEMRLVASKVEPLGEWQHAGAWPRGHAPDADMSRLVDRLGARLGPAQVYRIAPVESRMPERSVRRVPALAPPSGLVWPASLPRPTRLLDPPEPIVATALRRHRRNVRKGECHVAWQDVAAWSEGLIAVLLGDEADERLTADLQRLKATFGYRTYMALIRRFAPDEHLRLWAVEQAAHAARVPTVAMGDILYHHPSRRMLQDVVTCIRLKTTIDAAGLRLERHADRHLKDPGEMARLFERHPDAVARTLEIVARCRFSLDELRYQYPSETEGQESRAGDPGAAHLGGRPQPLSATACRTPSPPRSATS